MTRTVRVEYHCEDEQWWADSVDIGGWVAGGATLVEVRELVKEGLPFFLGDNDLEILEVLHDQPVVVSTVNGS